MMSFADPLRPARVAIHSGDFRGAWDSLQTLPDTPGVATEWNLLASMAVWRLGDFSQSTEQAALARDGFRRSGDVDGEMRAENVAAAGAFALGELDRAENGFVRARRLADGAGDGLLAARCANNLGNVHYYRGDHVSALNSYSLAVAEFGRERFDKGQAEAWHNMGIVLRDLDQLAEARAATDRAMEFARRAGDQRLVAQTLSSQAETLTLEGDVELSRVLADRALDLATAQEDGLTRIDATRVLSMISQAIGDFDAARSLAQDALEQAEELGHPWMIAVVNRQLGFAAEASGSADAAGYFEKAARLFADLGSAANAAAMELRAADQ